MYLSYYFSSFLGESTPKSSTATIAINTAIINENAAEYPSFNESNVWEYIHVKTTSVWCAGFPPVITAIGVYVLKSSYYQHHQDK